MRGPERSSVPYSAASWAARRNRLRTSRQRRRTRASLSGAKRCSSSARLAILGVRPLRALRAAATACAEFEEDGNESENQDFGRARRAGPAKRCAVCRRAVPRHAPPHGSLLSGARRKRGRAARRTRPRIRPRAQCVLLPWGRVVPLLRRPLRRGRAPGGGIRPVSARLLHDGVGWWVPVLLRE